MRKTHFLISFIICLVFSQSSFALLMRSTSFDNRNECEVSKGVWRQFGNGCANNCESQFDEFSVCTQSLVYACDCGKNNCWNGETCVALSEYKEIYDKKYAEEKKLLDAAKEKRKAAAKLSVESIMRNLVQKDSDASGKDKKDSKEPGVDYDKPRDSNIVINQPAKDQVQDSTQKEQDIVTKIDNFNPEQDIPSLYLKKQALQEKEQSAQSNSAAANNNSLSNSQNGSNSSGSSTAAVPPGLPVVPLPN